MNEQLWSFSSHFQSPTGDFVFFRKCSSQSTALILLITLPKLIQKIWDFYREMFLQIDSSDPSHHTSQTETGDLGLLAGNAPLNRQL